MYDYDKNGTIDYQGKLTVLSGFDAVSQAMENWVYVALSERVMYPEEGNNLIYYIGKKMDTETISQLEQNIASGIEEDFGSLVSVLTAEVTPVYDQGAINISITVKWRQKTKTVSTNLYL